MGLESFFAKASVDQLLVIMQHEKCEGVYKLAAETILKERMKEKGFLLVEVPKTA
jgi:hypothetical protein